MVSFFTRIFVICDKRLITKQSNIWKNGVRVCNQKRSHDTDVTISPMASQIISLGSVYSTVYSGADQRKHQSSASLTFVRRIYRGPVNSPHERPVTRKMFPFDDVIMYVMNGLASSGARLSIFKVMTRLGSCLYILAVLDVFSKDFLFL